jgi:UDP-2,3-diacylglucosamine pyrophosphatase LpxH
LARCGDFGYDILIHFNKYLNWTRKRFGLGYWSFSSYIKNKVKTAVQYISKFETVVVKECKTQNCFAIICGHIHTAGIKKIGDILYMNDGDWCESCTALVEDFDGSFHLIKFENNEFKIVESLLLINDEFVIKT